MISLRFTDEGLARAMCVAPGPVFAEKVIAGLDDGREITGTSSWPHPASQGAIEGTVTVPGGGLVRSLRLIAADGVCIALGGGYEHLDDGDRIHVQFAVTVPEVTPN